MRVLGVDPGLTRCGVGVVEGEPGRTCRLVAYDVVRTDPDADLAARLLALDTALAAMIGTHAPDEVAVLSAARAGLPVRTYTPSEVKAAVTGSGQADKAQVTTMVTRLLKLEAAPRPADAADALALAICHVWRGGVQARIEAARRLAVQRLAAERGAAR